MPLHRNTVIIVQLLLLPFMFSKNSMVFSADEPTPAHVNNRKRESSTEEKHMHAKQQKLTRIEMSTEDGLKLYQHWVEQMFIQLFALFVQQNFDEIVQRMQRDCFQQFGPSGVPKSASCISNFLKMQTTKKWKRKAKTVIMKGAAYQQEQNDNNIRRALIPPSTLFVGTSKLAAPTETITTGTAAKIRTEISMKTAAQNRRKRSQPSSKWQEVKQKTSYDLNTATRTAGMSMVGGLARLLHASIKKENIYAAAAAAIDVNSGWRQIKEPGNFGRFNAFSSSNQKLPTGWRRTVQEIKQIGRRFLDRRASAGPKKLFRLCKNCRRHPVPRTAAIEETSRANNNNDNNKNLEFLSPRFLSLMPEKRGDQTRKLLSPSLFSLHSKGEGLEKQLALSTLLQGLSGRDRDEWLNLIMDASGINKLLSTASSTSVSGEVNIQRDTNQQMGDQRQQKQQIPENFDDIEKQQKQVRNDNYLTKENISVLLGPREAQKIDVWEAMVRSLDAEQKRQMNVSGFTRMSLAQMELIYGADSSYNDTEAMHRLRPIIAKGINTKRLIETDIKRIARSSTFELRQHDIVLSPAAFRPRISTPLLLNTIVLSPTIFSPTINSPLVLGPLILSPRLFSPLVSKSSSPC